MVEAGAFNIDVPWKAASQASEINPKNLNLDKFADNVATSPKTPEVILEMESMLDFHRNQGRSLVDA